MTACSPSVLFVGSFLSDKGGRRAICEDVMERLRGREWVVYSTSSRPRRSARVVDMIARCHSVGGKVDVAHVDVFSGDAFIWAEISCWLLRRAGCPYILTLRGGQLPVFAERWPGRVRRLLHSAAVVTAPSGYLMEAMRPFRNDVLLLPNAVDLPAYTFRLRQRVSANLVWIRSFHRVYNPALAVRVVAALADEYPKLHLTMIGPDKDGSLGETRELASKLNVAGQITFTPGVPKRDVPARLAAADIFLNTTDIDNMPVTVVEAMACGLCVISTNAGGLPYVVCDGHDGLLVPRNDERAMAAAVKRVLDNPDLAGDLSCNARHSAERYDWAQIVEQWQGLLSAVPRRYHG